MTPERPDGLIPPEGERKGNAPSQEEFTHKIEELLLSCKRIGEGGKAVVLKLSIDQVSPELRSALELLELEADPDAPADKAVKLFKLYLPHKGAHEYKMHQAAFNALQTIPEGEEDRYAQIPALSSGREITFDTEEKHKLEERFSLPPMGDKSELIVMEYVDGEDLATIFYKWILENQKAFTAEQTDEMDFKALYREIALMLNFDPSPEDDDAPDPYAKELAEWKVSATNTEKIYSYLRKNNFPLPPKIVSRVENTLDLLHKARITHGDAFERNIMVTGGIKAMRSTGSLEGQRTFLIDFGESRTGFVEGVDDFNVTRRLKELSTPKGGKDKLVDQRMFDELSDKAELLRTRSKKWKEAYQNAKTLAESDANKAIDLAWNLTAGLDVNSIEDFFAIAKNLIEEGRIEKEIVAVFIAEKSEGKEMNPYQQKRIQECMRWLDA